MSDIILCQFLTSWYKNIVSSGLCGSNHDPVRLFFSAPRGTRPLEKFVCQTKTAICWEITNYKLPSSSTRPPRSRSLRGHSPLWRLYNSSDSLPPSHLSYHLRDWKQGPLRGRGDGTGRLPPRRTEIRVMSQIWQTQSLYGGLAGALPCCGSGIVGGINSELMQRTELLHMKTLPESLLAPSLGESTEDHMLRMWLTCWFVFGLSDICRPPAIWQRISCCTEIYSCVSSEVLAAWRIPMPVSSEHRLCTSLRINHKMQ